MKATDIREYMDEIGPIPLLDTREVRRLFDKMALGCSFSRDKLIKHNLKLVISIAKAFKNPRISMIDVIMHGNVGLAKAVDRFNHKRDIRFSTYASYWIRCEMFEALRKTPNDHIGTDPSTITPIEPGDGPLATVLKQDDTQTIATLLKNMHPRDFDIIARRFGLNGYSQHSYRDIGKKLGFSNTTVKEIEQRILRALRRRLLSDHPLSESVDGILPNNHKKDKPNEHERKEQRIHSSVHEGCVN